MLVVGEKKTRIPVRSLWFLLIYESGLLDQLSTGRREAMFGGDRDDHLSDIIVDLFVGDVEARLRRQLTPQYRDRAADLTRVRGRIDHLRTQGRRLLDRGTVACRFTELIVDTPRNRYIAAVLRKSAALVQSEELAHRCTAAAFALSRLGVGTRTPTRAELSRDRVGAHDRADQHLLSLARLVEDMALPVHEPGHIHLPEIDTGAHGRLRALFEKAIRNYYCRHLNPADWTVSAPILRWDRDANASGAALLPRMHTDTVLTHRNTRRRIIIETKFTDGLTEHYGKTRIKSEYLYQLYAYVMSQSQPDTEGVLLFVTTAGRTPIAESVTIQGHRIRFISLDLAQPLARIRQTLDSVLSQE
ncbi:McrC protein [Nocardia brasiliensis NBRC 14402]|uniref:5-methylcytosine restriction system specificity protein McrC n=1 Tax=Nocardia brasiliensis TaxID=37326 RepID=UPI0002F96192|nr:hypothetical protein [Nocardia brasiliensis]ASF06345.1 hypothetical protein CEQ30_02200 [Nocardia brasiliensis]GAJ81295.1 McrC protein [Nocardia brasiliensis NBRC 14402]SUB54049.1 5-methylcytosine-specific restriction enzyme subunit McrC [Nocardia brasiliensis]